MDTDRAHRSFLGEKFFTSLDGLRGLSIIPVVWHHAGGHQPGLLGQGHQGVQLFFAISGFLITTLLLREQERAGVISLRNFYVRRTLRIFPAYYATLFLYVALVTVMERGSPAGLQFWMNLRYYLTYTSNWFVDLASGPRVIFYFAWSLATEEQFYLMWPSVVRFARRWWQPVVVMVALLAASEWARFGVPPGTMMTSQPLQIRMLASIASPICLGCLLAYLLNSPSGFRAALRVAGARWSAPLATALLLASIAVEVVPPLVISLAMVYLVATVVVRPDHGMRIAFDNRALMYVGKISYGIYLYHLLAINAARRFGPSREPVIVFLLALPIAIGIATASYRWFELPFQRLKRRFEVRPVPAGSAAVAS